MDLAHSLGAEMLGWERRTLEDTTEWIDVVQRKEMSDCSLFIHSHSAVGHLDWDFPVLLHSSLHDMRGSGHPGIRSILPRIP